MSAWINAIHFSGPLVQARDVQHPLADVVECVDPHFRCGLLPSWIISGEVLDDGRTIFIAHSVRRRWTAVEYSLDALVENVRHQFPRSRVMAERAA